MVVNDGKEIIMENMNGSIKCAITYIGLYGNPIKIEHNIDTFIIDDFGNLILKKRITDDNGIVVSIETQAIYHSSSWKYYHLISESE